MNQRKRQREGCDDNAPRAKRVRAATSTVQHLEAVITEPADRSSQSWYNWKYEQLRARGISQRAAMDRAEAERIVNTPSRRRTNARLRRHLHSDSELARAGTESDLQQDYENSISGATATVLSKPADRSSPGKSEEEVLVKQCPPSDTSSQSWYSWRYDQLLAAGVGSRAAMDQAEAERIANTPSSRRRR
jgi:hypothetical protein